MDVQQLELRGNVPIVHERELEFDMQAAEAELKTQLVEAWGFMAIEVPGINEKVRELLSSFSDACSSTSPSLLDYPPLRFPKFRGVETMAISHFIPKCPGLRRVSLIQKSTCM